ncbi:hypothetical protein DRZ78_01705 [Candidatus Aerophobetes bacterium]|uniref:Asl1-like glycosyl hydrolase catalytic domain-containing protein n=1 Tax=Aerophobetes bacterium TaxID=2030807 RepID=A0A662D4P6_UNCAE|nr:MAG: hypothetical protein DRZ78_01705 [Candidatus Aerophobetes bacterium]
MIAAAAGGNTGRRVEWTREFIEERKRRPKLRNVILNIHTYMTKEDAQAMIDAVGIYAPKVWVTECGTKPWGAQIKYAREVLPLLIRKFPKVFWWCLYEAGRGFSLVDIGHRGRIEYSPLGYYMAFRRMKRR